jgi:tetratricopeptide (TPR) repeat protein
MLDNHPPQDIADQARLDYQAKNYPAAIQGYSDAAAGFLNIGNQMMAAEMKNNLAVVLLRNHQAKKAFEAVQYTDQVFAENGDFHRQGKALANKASILLALKDRKSAMQAFMSASDALEKAGALEDRFEVMKSLAFLYLGRFRFMDAILTLQTGLAGIKQPTPAQRLMKSLLSFRI